MKQQIPDQDEILRVLQSHAPRAMHVGELCGRLNLPRSTRDEVVRRLLLLADEDLVGEMPGLRFRALDAEKKKKRGREKAKSTRSRSRKARERIELAAAMAPAISSAPISCRVKASRFIFLIARRSVIFRLRQFS